MKIAVIGLGLIGGSMAKAVKQFTDDFVFGYDISDDVISKAISDGTVDDRLTDSNLALCDYIFIALYPQATIDFILDKKDIFKPDAVVVDCCGVKQKIVDAVDKIIDDVQWNFIGGHPMAGKEVGGYDNSESSLWHNAYFILTPCRKNDDSSIKSASAYIKNLGFKNITLSTPEHHDKVIAYTSQLPHVLACAYVFNPMSREHCGFSAGSYKDVSRVALINENLWTELFLDNKDSLCDEIDVLIKDLDSLKKSIESNDRDGLKDKLRTGRLIKTEIN